MSVRSRKVVRDLLSNPARTILVVAAIAIGLAGLSTTLRARAIFTTNLAAEIAVINPSSATVLTEGADESVVVAVEELDDVDDAEGRLVTFGRIGDDDVQRPLRLVVLNDLSTSKVDRLRPELGAWPPPTGTIALERSTLEVAGLEIGDISLITDPFGGTHEVPVAATVHDLTIVSGRLVDQVVFGYISTETWNQFGLASGFNEIAFTVTGDRTDENHISDVTDLVTDEVVNEGFIILGTRIPSPGKHAH